MCFVGPGMGNNQSSSNESAPKTRAGGEMTDQGNHGHLRGNTFNFSFMLLVLADHALNLFLFFH